MFNDRFSARANGLAGWWAGLGLVVLLGGCANVGQQDPLPDTVASGNAAAGSQAASATAASGATAAQPATDAAAQPAGPVTKVVTKTVWYRVRRGDTLARIAQKHGCSVKDLQAWKRLKPSSRLRNGQSLKIVSKQTVTVSEPGAAQSSSESASETREVKAGVARHANSVQLAWPAQGHVIEPFQPGETRGIEIAGKEGDPVLAAADGRVMYAGTGLNEYGSLIIVQHNKDFLTAYSHNRRLLVKTGDVVRQGQQIAEMGSENNSRVAVLFELRRDGKPIDPMPYLPQPNG